MKIKNEFILFNRYSPLMSYHIIYLFYHFSYHIQYRDVSFDENVE